MLLREDRMRVKSSLGLSSSQCLSSGQGEGKKTETLVEEDTESIQGFGPNSGKRTACREPLHPHRVPRAGQK